LANPLFELVEPCVFVLDQLAAFVALVGSERTDVTAVCLCRSVEPERAGDRRERLPRFSKAEGLRVDVAAWRASARAASPIPI
jgi:hypothetical protein